MTYKNTAMPMLQIFNCLMYSDLDVLGITFRTAWLLDYVQCLVFHKTTNNNNNVWKAAHFLPQVKEEGGGYLPFGPIRKRCFCSWPPFPLQDGNIQVLKHCQVLCFCEHPTLLKVRRPSRSKCNILVLELYDTDF
jgi:hypothetical protein